MCLLPRERFVAASKVFTDVRQLTLSSSNGKCAYFHQSYSSRRAGSSTDVLLCIPRLTPVDKDKVFGSGDGASPVKEMEEQRSFCRFIVQTKDPATIVQMIYTQSYPQLYHRQYKPYPQLCNIIIQ